MRQQTRVMVGIGILAIGLGAWYFLSGDSRDSDVPARGVPLARTEQPEEPMPPVAEVNGPRPSGRMQPVAVDDPAPPALSSGAIASPPPLVLPNLEERSFRPPIEATPPSPFRVTERQGLAGPDLAGPILSHAADSPEGDLQGNDEPSEFVALSEVPDVEPAGEPSAVAVPVTPVADAVPAVAEAKVIEHVIQPGDTYSSLAVKYLGGVRYTDLIAKANPGKDSRRLFVGSKIIIPAPPVAAQAEAATAAPGSSRTGSTGQARTASVTPVPVDRAYQVQPGESWSDLARKFLGDANQWPKLYELNKERVVRDPNGLRAGTTIELPPGVVASAKP